ncbi:MAG: inorganic phosphate transporter family protein [Candidatus Cloacimonetes bacterium]|nr:inorganic phosphate transporter family protein [Candidatus Cloacimonadota bacterium]
MSSSLFFLTSGLFLAWSLGANNAANIFGPAVGTKMVRFYTAAAITSVFVIAGAVLEGGGAASTLGRLGAVNALAGSFTVALAVAVTVFLMTKVGLPVSTSQAIVGGIIGWNFFTGFNTDWSIMADIVATWIFSPVLAGVFASSLFLLFNFILKHSNIHLLKQDVFTRTMYIVVGAFGAYSLGANNIANAMGVFVPTFPFEGLTINGAQWLSSTQVLFLLGSIAIGVGVFTYSYKVIRTVGNEIFRMSPIAGLIVVMSESLVLFLFGSKSLKMLLTNWGLPSFPLVPVSSSQAIVGAVLGIALAKGGRNINFKVLGRISIGWVVTPLIACIITFFTLYVMQNVFEQQVVIQTMNLQP